MEWKLHPPSCLRQSKERKIPLLKKKCYENAILKTKKLNDIKESININFRRCKENLKINHANYYKSMKLHIKYIQLNG